MNQKYFDGTVRGILSGDSIIVDFRPPCPKQYQVIHLNYLIAPKFGSSNGKIKDEPHGFESWDFLRKKCLGCHVQIFSTSRPRNNTTHTIFGELPVTFTRVSLFMDNTKQKDLGLLVVEEGMVKLRDDIKSENSYYLQQLQKAQEEAKKKKIGIWAEQSGFIRPLPVSYSVSEILMQQKYRAIVEGVVNGTTFSLFLMPSHILIQFQLAGCRAKSVKKNDEKKSIYGTEARERSIIKFFQKHLQIRICSKSENGPFIGHFVNKNPLKGPDNEIVSMIKEGLIAFNPQTADFAPNADRYILAEHQAKLEKLKIWSDYQLEEKKGQDFQGKIELIRSSSSIVVNGTEKKLFYFSSIRVPYFFYKFGGSAEKYGFEAREFLRTNFLGKDVKVISDGCEGNREYATVYCDGKCINEELCKVGLARVDDTVGKKSDQYQNFEKAQKEAEQKKIGIFSTEKHKCFTVKDTTLIEHGGNEEYLGQLKGQTFDAIIEQIFSTNKFCVLIPKMHLIIRTGLEGLLSFGNNEVCGSESRQFCQKFLQQSILITVCSVDKYDCFFSDIVLKDTKVDISTELLKNGLADLHPLYRTIKTQNEHASARISAIESRTGIWADMTRHTYSLKYNKPEPVKLVSVYSESSLHLDVQLLSKDMETIEKVLSRPLTELTADDIANLRRSECVAVQTPKGVMRARIQALGENNSKVTSVKLIDTNEITNTFTTVYALPEPLTKIVPQAISVRLGCVKLFNNNTNVQKAIEKVYELCEDAKLYVHLMNDDSEPLVLITDHESIDSTSLNCLMFAYGFGHYVSCNAPQNFEQVCKKLREYSEKAQAQRNEKK
ncbi:Tudor domain containing protein [Histomonas meleagridis]|uniref:Tudor domain containing protein n=1 Tax=Histomonas meleagridis TaxID=135588 RepID=UPI00355A0090|nr:Tudor domain containing protein [Histomonas meleagridis]KAH0799231.1 Tudor domain containing protein [Histomonas meleagridis]